MLIMDWKKQSFKYRCESFINLMIFMALLTSLSFFTYQIDGLFSVCHLIIHNLKNMERSDDCSQSSCSQARFVSKNSKLWTRDATTALILLYEQHPCLYAIKSRDYHNKAKRAAALLQITRTLQEDHGQNVTQDDILKKIHGLRTQFLSEINKIKKAEHSGMGHNSHYTPTLWCFDLLHFLQDTNPVVTKGTSNMSEDILEVIEINENAVLDNTQNGYEDAERERSNSSPAPDVQKVTRNEINTQHGTAKRRKTDSSKEFSQIMSKAVNALETVSASEQSSREDAQAIFGQMVAAELRCIDDEEITDEIKFKIMEIIFNGKRMFRNKSQHN